MENLKFTGKNQFQGDTQWFELSELPKGLKKVEKRFIAASEKSGSFHALFGKYDMYEVKDEGFIIDAKEDCIINHSLQSTLENQKSLDEAKILTKKDHRHSVLAKGIHFVGIQLKFDPLSGLKEKVKD